ncbi:MAG TPA: AIM24 family protein, partial [Acidimicrobiales bacterium]
MTEEVDGGLPAFADPDGAGVAHRVIGDTLPVLEVQLKSGQSVISQGGELSWMSPTITMTTQTAGAGGSGFVGVLKRA